MASGDSLVILTPQANEAPAASYATLDLRNAHPVLDFDADADESAVFTGILPRNYAGGGLTVNLHWAASTDTNAAHACVWEVSFEAISGLDIDGDSFAAIQFLHGHPNGTSGIETVTAIPVANGGEMDSIAVGGAFRVKVSRDADATNDTDDMTGDAELLVVEIQET